MFELVVMIAFSWVSECQAMINRETVQYNDTYTAELLYAIPQGIHLANVINEVDRNDRENLDRCALAIAVARFESTFNVRAKNKTCLGMYQMTASTVKDVLKDTSFLSRPIKDSILTPMSGSCIFSLLMDKFMKRGLFKALVRYNGSVRISRKIMKYYKELVNG